jgi:hypothetical protein
MPNFKLNNALSLVGFLGAASTIILFATFLGGANSALAQDSTEARSGAPTKSPSPDPLGVRDTLHLNVESTGEDSWMVDVACYNDEELFGLSIPLRFTSGLRRVYIDSTIFTGGRVDYFQVKLARADTAIQRLTIGLIAALSPDAKVLDSGNGSLAKVYLHAEGEGKGLKVDTTTTAPQNSLLFIYSDMKDGNLQIKIFPEVVINGELAVKPEKKSGKKSRK